jgi:type II secretory pathway pseudopilin PulG
MLKPLLVIRAARRPSRAEQGYILLTLMLFVALVAIALAVEMPILKQQIQRDQEEEMVHRGAEYARAIRRYYRKFGRYPVSIELLESQNNLRFLRKRYKDPVNGGDFQVLHMTDVKLGFGAGFAGGRSLGRPLNSAFNPGDSAGTASDPNAAHGTTTSAGTASDPNAAHGTTTPASDTPAPATPGTAPGDSTSNSPFTSASGQPTGPTLGAAPIVGVASTSTKESIRVYNKKNHYNEWQFIYDPTVDRGWLITGPYEPVLQTMLPGQGGMGMGTGSSQGSTQYTPGTVPPPNPNPLPH